MTLCPGCPWLIRLTGAVRFCQASIRALISTPKQLAKELIANIQNPSLNSNQQRRQLDLLAAMNEKHRSQRSEDPNLEARIQSFELAYRMQMEATDALDIASEPTHIHTLYGSETVHGRQMLIARRLIERGVRVVQCYHGDVQPWDSHGNIDSEHRRWVAKPTVP